MQSDPFGGRQHPRQHDLFYYAAFADAAGVHRLIQERASSNASDVLAIPDRDARIEASRALDDLLARSAVDTRETRWAFTPLILAAAKGEMEVVKNLVSAGADLEMADVNGNTALHVACLCNHASVVEVLLAGKFWGALDS